MYHSRYHAEYEFRKNLYKKRNLPPVKIPDKQIIFDILWEKSKQIQEEWDRQNVLEETDVN